jgi:hypothetical protein
MLIIFFKSNLTGDLMPAKSKQQKKFFYAVKNYKESLKRGKKKPKVSKAIKDAAESMSMKQINDFLETKGNLPTKVKQANQELMLELITLANQFDDSGLSVESDMVDSIISLLSED